MDPVSFDSLAAAIADTLVSVQRTSAVPWYQTASGWADALAFAGLAGTVYALSSANRLRARYLRKHRLPELVDGLRDATDRLSDAMDQDPIRGSDLAEATEGVVRSLDVAAQHSGRHARKTIRRGQKTIGPPETVTSLRQAQNARRIARGLHVVLQSIVQDDQAAAL